MIPDPINHTNNQECALFAHESVMSRPQLARAIDIAVRDAWLELRMHPPLLEAVVDSFFESPEYLKYISRFAGLYALAA